MFILKGYCLDEKEPSLDEVVLDFQSTGAGYRLINSSGRCPRIDESLSELTKDGWYLVDSRSPGKSSVGEESFRLSVSGVNPSSSVSRIGVGFLGDLGRYLLFDDWNIHMLPSSESSESSCAGSSCKDFYCVQIERVRVAAGVMSLPKIAKISQVSWTGQKMNMIAQTQSRQEHELVQE